MVRNKQGKMCVCEEERNYRLIAGRRIALSWLCSCSSAMRKMRNFTGLNSSHQTLSRQHGDVNIAKYSLSWLRLLFVSGLLSNLCCSRSSVAAVIVFFFLTSLNTSQGDKWKLKNEFSPGHLLACAGYLFLLQFWCGRDTELVLRWLCGTVTSHYSLFNI